MNTAAPLAPVKKKHGTGISSSSLGALCTLVTFWQHWAPSSLWQEWLGLKDACFPWGLCHPSGTPDLLP